MRQYTYVIAALFLLAGFSAFADGPSLSKEVGSAQDQHIIVTDTLDANVAGCLVDSGATFEVYPAEKAGSSVQNADCVADCTQQRALCKQWHDPALCDAWWYQCMSGCGGFN